MAPETDDISHFEGLKRLYLGDTPEAAQSYDVQFVRYQQTKKGPVVLVKLAGVNTREAADALRGSWVFAEEEELPPLEEGEFFLHDLKGLPDQTETGERIGYVREVLRLPGQDKLVVEQKNGREVMIPLVPELVPEINLEEKRIVIRPIEGLLES